MAPKWLEWVQQLEAIAHIGLTFSDNPYDIERYEKLRRIAAEMAAHHTNEDPEILEKLFTRLPDYPTPKVDVRGIVISDGKILLIRERTDGKWAPPGGWADVGDPPAEAVIREVEEEAGYIVRVTKLAALYDRNKHMHEPNPLHIYKLFFLCEVIGGAENPNHETSDVAWFAPDDLPPLSLLRITHYQIERMFVHHNNPDLPTEYD